MYIRLFISALCLLMMGSMAYGAAEAKDHGAPAMPKDAAHVEPSSKATTADVGAKEAKAPLSDVRVLIDVSGSMKKTDPKNFRKPALDLLVRLLPDKSRAGVWLFGNDVNLLVPHTMVDAAWRKQASSKSQLISSAALFTNIGKALEQVSFDRKALSSEYKTHIVLLTDGVVDISKDSANNTQERKRILNEILPGLKSAGYVVHTIALSADADVDLLKKISLATDGVFTNAQSADELTNIFLKIFDQAVPADRLPLENNGFLVDASVKEFTALIFRKPGVERSVILSPDGKEFSSTSPGDGLNWYRTDKYDLITADAPKAGQWKIKTEITPQSRITVVSDLQLIMVPLKNNIHINESLALNYSFQENGQTVINKDFLGLLETNAIIAKDGTLENSTLELTVTKPPADGMYHQNTHVFPDVGDYSMHIYVDGKTFKREFKHNVSVRNSLISVAKDSAVSENGKITYSYKITADEKIVDVKKVQVTVTVKSTKNSNVDTLLNLVEDSYWEFSYAPVATADYNISIHAQGETKDGEKLDETVNAQKFSYVAQLVPEKTVAPVAPVVPVKTDVPPVENKADKMSGLWLYIGIAVANLLIAVIGYFVYRKFIAGKGKDELSDVEKVLEADIKPAKKEPEKKAAPKMEIDLSAEKPAAIPISDLSSMDNLFPLDTMEDSDKT